MAEFYRATRVEELDREHPGLKDFVDESLRRRVRQKDILSGLLSRYGVQISSTAISEYWSKRIHPQEVADLESWRQARNQYWLAREEMEANPNSDAAKIIQGLVVQGIYEQKQRLIEADVMALVAEQRKRQELEEKMAVEWGKLDIQLKKLENEKRRLEERHTRVGAVVEEAEKAAAEGKAFDPGKALKMISEVIGVGGELEPRVESGNS